MAITNLVSVRLTKKLAAKLNGIDVSSLRVGDRIELPESAARMLIAEGWAEPVPPAGQPRLESSLPSHLIN